MKRENIEIVISKEVHPKSSVTETTEKAPKTSSEIEEARNVEIYLFGHLPLSQLIAFYMYKGGVNPYILEHERGIQFIDWISKTMIDNLKLLIGNRCRQYKKYEIMLNDVGV